MHAFKTLIATAAIIMTVAASPARMVETRNICNGFIGNCYENGCGGEIDDDSLFGTCTTGKFDGCPCARCGETNGSCTDNGCFGDQGLCTAGPYLGCDCN